MGKLIAFPKSKPAPLEGLTKQECDAVQAEAYDLMIEGCATGISFHEDGKYMCVFDQNGSPYSVRRETGGYYLRDNNEMILARSERFEIVLAALELTFSPSSDETESL